MKKKQSENTLETEENEKNDIFINEKSLFEIEPKKISKNKVFPECLLNSKRIYYENHENQEKQILIVEKKKSEEIEDKYKNFIKDLNLESITEKNNNKNEIINEKSISIFIKKNFKKLKLFKMIFL